MSYLSGWNIYTTFNKIFIVVAVKQKIYHNNWRHVTIFLSNFKYGQFTCTNINLTKLESLKPSRFGDISLLVFKISKEAVKQPCLDQIIQCLFLKYSYFLCIFWHKFFRAFSFIPKCYFKDSSVKAESLKNRKIIM